MINAIKHGNRNDATKHVFVEFETAPTPTSPELAIRVRDQGDGFDPEIVADPLDAGEPAEVAAAAASS